MSYTPRFYQPFTLREAMALDVSVITEEISRLQHSLQKLDETQIVLKEEMDDPDINKAYDENEQVIGSQKERISILKMVLKEKGLLAGPHYDLEPAQSEPTQPTTQSVDTHPSTSPGAEPTLEQSTTNHDDDNGVYL